MPKMTKVPKIADEYHFIIKKVERSDSTLRHSIFDILRFCGSAGFRSRLQRDSLFVKAFEQLLPISDRPGLCSGPALLPARAGRSDWKYEKNLSADRMRIF
jgi:hypothetical protein